MSSCPRWTPSAPDFTAYLYAAALLKMFRARGLDYRTHFGGVYYLFLRGLGSGVNGIWHDVPPEPCLNALLGLFEKGGMS